MNILAIETATATCAIALGDGDDVIGRVLDTDRHHTEVLTAGIVALLGEAGLAARDLERVVVDRGPGLFTGLRVGLAAAGALAHGLAVPLVGLSSLELLAHGAADSGVRGRLVALVDARRGELFVQSFSLTDAGPVVLDEPRVLSRDDARAVIEGDGPVTVTGDGAARYLDELTRGPHVDHHEALVPSLSAAIALGATRSTPSDVTPMYLREADAVANFSTRERPS